VTLELPKLVPVLANDEVKRARLHVLHDVLHVIEDVLLDTLSVLCVLAHTLRDGDELLIVLWFFEQVLDNLFQLLLQLLLMVRFL
jgi:hypothetical protein